MIASASDVFKDGVHSFSLGFSVHYNPYRNIPADGRFGEWQEGWEHAKKESKVLHNSDTTAQTRGRDTTTPDSKGRSLAS